VAKRYSGAIPEEVVKAITENVTRQKTVSALHSQGKPKAEGKYRISCKRKAMI